MGWICSQLWLYFLDDGSYIEDDANQGPDRVPLTQAPLSLLLKRTVPPSPWGEWILKGKGIENQEWIRKANHDGMEAASETALRYF